MAKRSIGRGSHRATGLALIAAGCVTQAEAFKVTRPPTNHQLPGQPAKATPPPSDGISQDGKVSNAAQVVASLRRQFKACYDNTLGKDPEATGQVYLKIAVGSLGEVTGIKAETTGRLPLAVSECMKGAARAANFDPPTGGRAVIAVPVSFVTDNHAAESTKAGNIKETEKQRDLNSPPSDADETLNGTD